MLCAVIWSQSCRSLRHAVQRVPCAPCDSQAMRALRASSVYAAASFAGGAAAALARCVASSLPASSSAPLPSAPSAAQRQIGAGMGHSMCATSQSALLCLAGQTRAEHTPQDTTCEDSDSPISRLGHAMPCASPDAALSGSSISMASAFSSAPCGLAASRAGGASRLAAAEASKSCVVPHRRISSSRRGPLDDALCLQ